MLSKSMMSSQRTSRESMGVKRVLDGSSYLSAVDEDELGAHWGFWAFEDEAIIHTDWWGFLKDGFANEKLREKTVARRSKSELCIY